MFDFILNILKDDGCIFICEVITLTSGEMPYGESGYLVLGEKQINLLFNETNLKTLHFKQAENTQTIRENTYAIAIPRDLINRVTPETIKATIESLRDDSLEAAKKIMKSKKSSDSRKYAFHSQQHINAVIALDLLNEPASKNFEVIQSEVHMEDEEAQTNWSLT